jgi:hypothetical protein
MSLFRLVAIALLIGAICGCQLFKDDPLIGEHPWQPGQPPPQKSSSQQTGS